MPKRRKTNIGRSLCLKNSRDNSLRTGGTNLYRSRGCSAKLDFKMSTKHKFLHWLTYVTFSLTMALIIVVVYYMFFPIKVMEVSNAPFPVVNKTVRAGGTLQHIVEYCKYVEMPSDSSRQLVNGLIYTMATVTNDNPIGCHTVTSITLIPQELPPGTYRLRITKTYHLNPIRDFTITNETEEFNVIN